MMRWVEKALQVWRRTIELTTAPTLLSPPLTGHWRMGLDLLSPAKCTLPALQLSRIKGAGRDEECRREGFCSRKARRSGSDREIGEGIELQGAGLGHLGMGDPMGSCRSINEDGCDQLACFMTAEITLASMESMLSLHAGLITQRIMDGRSDVMHAEAVAESRYGTIEDGQPWTLRSQAGSSGWALSLQHHAAGIGCRAPDWRQRPLIALLIPAVCRGASDHILLYPYAISIIYDR